MATQGHEIATAYVSIVPSMEGVQAGLAKGFTGVAKGLAKEVDQIPNRLKQTMQKVQRTVGTGSKSILDGALKSVNGLIQQTGRLGAAASGAAVDFDKLPRSVQLLSRHIGGAEGATQKFNSAAGKLKGGVRGVQDFVSGFRDAKVAATSFVGPMAAVGASVRHTFDKGVKGVQDFAGGFKDAKAAASSFTGPLGKVGAQARVLTDGLGKAGVAAQKLGIAALKPAQNFIAGFQDSKAAASALTGVMGTLGGVSQRLGEWAKRPGQNFIAGFRDSKAAASALTGVMGTLGGAAQTTSRFIGDNYRQVMAVTTSAIKTVGPAAGAMFQGVTAGFARLTTGAVKGGMAIVQGVTGAMKDIGQQAKQALAGPATVAVTTGVAAIGVALKKGLGRLNTIDVARQKMAGLGLTTAQTADVMKSAENAVVGTMYGLDAAATVASGAVAAGIAQGEQLDNTMKAIVNTSAASGRAIEDVGYIFNKVAATNQAYTQEINQIAQSGIPIWRELAKVMGVSDGEVRSMVSSGAVTFEIFREAAMNATGDIAEAMGKTLPGAVANFGAALARIGQNLFRGSETVGPEGEVQMTGIYQRLAPLVIAVTKAMKPLETTATRIGEAIGDRLNPLLDKLVGWLERFTDRAKLAEMQAKALGRPIESMAGGAELLNKVMGQSTNAFNGVLDVLKPLSMALIPLGAAGMAPLLQMFGRFRPLLGPIPMLLGALGSSASIAAFALVGLSKADPSKMLVGFESIVAAIPAIVDKMVSHMVTLATRLLPAFLEGLQTNLPILVAGLTEVVAAILEAFGSKSTILPGIFYSIFQSIADTITVLVPQVVTVLTTLVPMLAQVLLANVPVMLDAAVTLLYAIVEAAQALIPAITQMAFTIVTDFVEALMSYLPKFITAGIELVTGFAQAIVLRIPELLAGMTRLMNAVVGGIIQMVPQLVTAVLTAIPLLVDAGLAVIQGFVSSLDGFTDMLGNAVRELLPMLVQYVVQGVPMLIDGAGVLFTALLTALEDVVGNLLHAVTDLVPNVVTALVEMLPTLINGAITLFTGIIKALGTIVGTIVSMTSTLVRDLVGALVKSAPLLIQGAVALFQGLLVGLAETVGALVTMISEMIMPLVGALVGLLPALLEGAIELFMALVQAVPVVLFALIDTISAMVMPILEAVLEMLPALLDAAITLFLGLAQGVVAVLPELLIALQMVLPEILGTLTAMIPYLLGTAIELFMNLVLAVIEILPDLLQTIIGLLPEIVATIISMVPDLLMAGIALFFGLVKAIPEVLEPLGEALGDLWQHIKDFFAELPAKMVEIGKDLLQGLTDGIMGGIKSVGEAIGNVGSSIVSGITGFLGIHSPSKVMAEIGGYITRGLAEGIDDSTAGVQSVNRLSAQVLAAMRLMQTQVSKVATTIGASIGNILTSLQRLMNVMKGQFRATVVKEVQGVANVFKSDFPRAVTQSVAVLRTTLSAFTKWFTSTFAGTLRSVVASLTTQLRTQFSSFSSWYAATFTKVLSSGTNNLVTGMRGAFQTFLTWFKGTFTNGLLTAITQIRKAFVDLPGAVSTAWSRIKAGTAIPSNFVIQTVYMSGVRNAVNTIAKAVGVKTTMPAVSKIAYATGSAGILPGYTPGRDVYDFYSPQVGHLRLSGGEGILRPEVARALGPETINAWNASRGRDLGGYAKGGILNYLKKTKSGWSVNTDGGFLGDIYSDPAAGMKALVTDPAKEYASRAGGATFGAAMGAAMTRVASSVASEMASKIEAILPDEADLGSTGFTPTGSVMGYQAMVAILKKAFPGITITSTYRPGAITATGYKSLHGMGRAVDMTPSMQIFNWIKKHFPNSTEIIYSPAGAGQVYKGRPYLYPEPTRSMHFNHVHWGMKGGGVVPNLYDDGGWLQPGLTLAENKTGKPEPVFTSLEQARGLVGGVRDVYFQVDVSEVRDIAEAADVMKTLDRRIRMGVAHGVGST